MLKGVIFDLDGTITLTEPLQYQAYAQLFKEHGIDFSFEEQIEKYAGSGSKIIFTKVFEDRGVPLSAQQLEELLDKKKIVYTKIVQESKIEVVPGVIEFVKKIQQRGLKKIIATGNSNLDAVHFILNKIGLLEYFPLIVPISAVPHGKPFPDVFLEAARQIECAPNEALIFEDAINGVAAAKAAGIRCIAVETTTKRQELLYAGASLVVKDYSEITDDMLL